MGAANATSCCCANDDAAQTVDLSNASPRPGDAVATYGVGEAMMSVPPVQAEKIVFEAKAQFGDSADAAVFAGAWTNSSKDNVYIITGTMLKWSSTTVSTIKCSGVQLQIEGSDMTGFLDEVEGQLQWSDGDIWVRAGFNGYWYKAGTDGCWAIDGSTLTTTTAAGQKWTNPLGIVSPTSAIITIDGAIVTGTLDKTAMKLTWSDGDVWNRTWPEDFK